MVDWSDLDTTSRAIDDWQAGFDERAAQARDLSARFGRLEATARSDDGLVSVSVGPTGALVGLDLAEGIRTRPAADTARQILATLGAAQVRLLGLATTAVAETVGTDSETGQAVIAALEARR